jgi:hypothetical protein
VVEDDPAVCAAKTHKYKRLILESAQIFDAIKR